MEALTTIFQYTLLGILVLTLILAITLIICVPLLCLILSALSAKTEVGKEGEIYLYSTKILKGTASLKGIFYYILVAFVLTLFLPNIFLDEYTMDEKKLPSVIILYHQAVDTMTGPIEVTVRNCTETHDRYSNNWYTTKTYLTRYAKYERDGIYYKTPCSIPFYEELINVTAEMDIEVLLYPNTGIIEDFKEKPLSLYEPEQQLEILKEKYGYPYTLSVDEKGLIQISKNELYPEEYYDRYYDVLEYRKFWIRYEGGEPYVESVNSNAEKSNIEILYDGTYEIILSNWDQQQLAEQLTLETKQEVITSINGTPSDIDVFYVVKPAGDDEVYSEAMQQFIDRAEELGYDVDYLLYHYNKDDGGRYFFYKYLSAFHSELMHSIQVYECENETDALDTYKSWMNSYGDTCCIVLKDKVVYIFWGNDGKTTAEKFGLL